MAADDGNMEKKKKMMVGCSFVSSSGKSLFEVSNILIAWLFFLR